MTTVTTSRASTTMDRQRSGQRASVSVAPDDSFQASHTTDARPDPIVAPGYQCVLLPPAPGRTVRWRSVRRDGTRFPPVGDLGVVIAQARVLARADGAAWIVGSDHHTIEIHTPLPQPGHATTGFAVTGCGPRWTHTVAQALTR